MSIVSHFVDITLCAGLVGLCVAVLSLGARVRKLEERRERRDEG